MNEYRLPDDYVNVAWKWFRDTFGIVTECRTIERENRKCTIKIEFGDRCYSVVFPSDFEINLKDFVNDVIWNIRFYIDGNRLVIDQDIFALIYLTISGNLERNLDRSLFLRLVGKPYLDIISNRMFDMIKKMIGNNDILITKPFLTDNSFAVCLTHDVDEIKKTYQYITRSLRSLRNRDLEGVLKELRSFIRKMKGKEPYWTFEKLIELEKSMGVRSTLYFLKETGKVKITDPSTWRHLGRRYEFDDVADVIKFLHSRGWEVGLHGSFYSYRDRSLLKREKLELERILGKRVIGIRQHNLNLDIPQTWRIQESLGFEYDTTLGSNHYVGFRWGTCYPFYPYDEERQRFLRVLQIPLHIEDIAVFREDDPWRICVQTLWEVKRMGGVLTLLWHHAVFDEDEYPGWAKLYRDLIEFCKRENALVTKAEDIARIWRNRLNSNVSVEYEGKFVSVRVEGCIPLRIYSPSKLIVNDSDVTIRRGNGYLDVYCKKSEFKIKSV